METLLLTKSENALFGKVPKSITDAWGGTVTMETNDSFETEDLLQTRLQTLKELKNRPAVANLVKKAVEEIESTGDIARVDFSHLDEETLHLYFSGIGALGVSALIEFGLQEVASPEDLKALSYVSHIRHGLLESNKHSLLAS